MRALLPLACAAALLSACASDGSLSPVLTSDIARVEACAQLEVQTALAEARWDRLDEGERADVLLALGDAGIFCAPDAPGGAFAAAIISRHVVRVGKIVAAEAF